MEKLKVLIPTDFTVQAEYAYLLVKRLEEKIAMEIHFLHVLDVPDTVTLSDTGVIETCGEIDVNFVKSKKDIADRKLSNLKNVYGNAINTHLVFGKITSAITFFASNNKFDLIVMGTKGAWGLKEKISGSEAQIIARQSEIPLLSMMCDRSDLSIENILLVHDFSKPVNENLQLMQTLIRAFDPKVHLLQIVTTETENIWLLAQMDAFAEINHISRYEKHLLTDSDVENGVIHFNQMHEMDIICIGTRGRKGIDTILHPSATEKLINHLFKPIISFHLAQ
ncbi:MAG: universal stress protein [Bacteroidetes bacterium]|nr:universal stress protein [Bacteroidota bacterium]